MLQIHMVQNGKEFFMNVVALILMIAGALNWGLIGFFDFNLVDAIFGVGSLLSRIIYALVGVAGLWGIVMLFQRNVRRMGPCTEE